MTQTKIDALMAQAGLKQILINKANRELDRLNQKKANYEKQHGEGFYVDYVMLQA